jgi:hypothetical protein
LLVLTAVALPAQAAPIYKWVDERGDWHITDRLASVPEPFYSLFVAEERKRKAAEAGQKPADATPMPPPQAAATVAKPPPRRDKASSRREEDNKDEQRWRGLVAEAQAELRAATDELEAIDDEIGAKEANPMLRETAPVKSELTKLRERRGIALERLAKARHTLQVELPKRAKREGVPPGWLREGRAPASGG